MRGSLVSCSTPHACCLFPCFLHAGRNAIVPLGTILGCWVLLGLCSAMGMCDGNAWKAVQGYPWPRVCTLHITAALGT